MKKVIPQLLCLFMSHILASQTFTKNTIDNDTGNGPYVIASGHLDNDLFLDIAIGTEGSSEVKWYKNNGDGTFNPAISLIANAPHNLINIYGLAIADINGDNANDIVATSFTNDNLVWFQNNGNGTFQNAVTLLNNIDSAGAIKIANIDNDPNNNLDIIVSVYGYDGDTDSLLYLLGNGDGTFSSIKYIIPETAGLGTGEFDVADFDNDGDLDIVVSFVDIGTVEVYDNRLIQDGLDANGNIPFIKYDNTVSSGNGYIFDIFFADINDDNILDIIKTDNNPTGGNSGVVWYEKSTNSTAATFTAHQITTTIQRSGVAAVADLNNDNFNDLVITNGRASDNDLVWFESDVTGNLGSETLISDSQPSGFDLNINDFDNDTDLDIVSISYLSNDLNIFINETYTLNSQSVEFQNKSLSIYPNPAKNVLHIKTNLSNIGVATVYNILGKKVLNTHLSENKSIDISKLSHGIYILKFSNSDKAFKFIKE
ncbi:T9SS type A sorting domain-containing protein [Corallibacter sp.]|uniref:T9SS type A sorting domain-containing protein n=1 Tax=Corallibacter sp. TaxID=2038084 RepID=UPI003A912BFF